MAEILQVFDRYFIHNVPRVFPILSVLCQMFQAPSTATNTKKHKKLGNDTYLFKLMISIPHISPAWDTPEDWRRPWKAPLAHPNERDEREEASSVRRRRMRTLRPWLRRWLCQQSFRGSWDLVKKDVITGLTRVKFDKSYKFSHMYMIFTLYSTDFLFCWFGTKNFLRRRTVRSGQRS